MKWTVYETGISDLDKIIFSVLRKTFAIKANQKLFSKVFKMYQNSFNKAFQNKISQPDLSFEQFLGMFQSTLDAFAPYKQ